MHKLTPKQPSQFQIGEVFQLEESVLDRLSGRGKQGLSPNTRVAYRQVIGHFNRFVSENQLAINEQSVRAYFESLSDLAPATLNHKKYALLKVIKTQMGEGNALKVLLIEKAFEAIATYQIDKRISEGQCLTEAQVEGLIAAASTQRTKLLIHFLFKTGCRVSELIGVRLRHCKMISDKVEVRILGKGKKVRRVIIPKSLFDAVRSVYQGKTWLFESRNGRPLDRNNIRKQLKKTGQAIGLENLHPHMLRHTRATDMIINKGVSTKAASQYLGHASTAITLDMYVKDRVDVDLLFSRDAI